MKTELFSFLVVTPGGQSRGRMIYMAWILLAVTSRREMYLGEREREREKKQHIYHDKGNGFLHTRATESDL